MHRFCTSDLNKSFALVAWLCGKNLAFFIPTCAIAQIFTNNTSALGQELSRDVSHSPAIQQEPMSQIEPQPAHGTEIVRGYGLGLSCQDRIFFRSRKP
jgi:hypothetical protein